MKIAYWFCPASQEPTLRRDCHVVVELDVLLRIDVVFSKRRFEEQKRRASWAEAENFLALEDAPIEFVDFFAADQHEAVGRREPAEDRELGRGLAVLDVDRSLRPDQRDVSAAGQHQCRRLVAALRGRQRNVEAGVLEKALGYGDVGWCVQDRTHDLTITDIDWRLALRAQSQRRD